MALRQLRVEGDPILRKKCREITSVDAKMLQLLDDMAETMIKEEGAGLAAPQVGVLKRMVTIVVEDKVMKLINPVIIHQEGERIDQEACLSVPGRVEYVKRPEIVKVRYIDVNGKKKIMKCKGFYSKLLCHEIDHLNGILFIDKAIKR